MRNTRPSKKCYPFRVFVSYSHEDQDKAEQVVDVLRKLGMVPIWDEHITPGAPFSDAIKGLIAHSHVFLPLITTTSMKKPWVHQETGYAMALDIPVLPVAIAKRPDQMIAQLEAVMVSLDLSDLKTRLNEVNVEQVVFPGPPRPKSGMEVADHPEDRAKMLAASANRIMQHGVCGRLRQRAAYSSLSIPDQDLTDLIWECREGTRKQSAYHRHYMREERVALERHARAKGCSLVIDPTFPLSQREPNTTRAYLSVLLEFLESMPDRACKVAMTSKALQGNITIVGDWFVADSVAARRRVGYRQTVFQWHAPTVLQRVREFDREFDGYLRQQRTRPTASRRAAIARIEEILKGLGPCKRRQKTEPELRGACCQIAERLFGKRARTRRRAG
jgi:hypothetical protein